MVSGLFREMTNDLEGVPCPEGGVETAKVPVEAFQRPSQASRAGIWALGGELEQSRRQAIEDTYQCAILRDLFRHPFRPLTFDPSWRTPPTP